MADKREIQRQIDRLTELESKSVYPIYPGEFEPWRAQTERVLATLFGSDSLQLAQFRAIHYGPIIVLSSDGPEVWDSHFHRGLAQAKRLLVSFMEDLSESLGDGEKNRLTCPKCQSVEVDFLELRPAGGTEVGGGIKFFGRIGGKKKNIKTLAYYRCRICNSVFSVEPVKSKEQA